MTNYQHTIPLWIYHPLQALSVLCAVLFTAFASILLYEGYWLAALLYAPLAATGFVLLITALRHNVTEVATMYTYRHAVRFTPTKAAISWPTFPRGEYVYILQDVDVTGYCKIGYTNEPSRRKRKFDVTLPFDVEFVHIIDCGENSRETIESRLHLRFSHKRVRGEWFDLDADDIAYLKSL